MKPRNENIKEEAPVEIQWVLQNVVKATRISDFSVQVQFTSARMASEFLNKIGEAMK